MTDVAAHLATACQTSSSHPTTVISVSVYHIWYKAEDMITTGVGRVPISFLDHLANAVCNTQSV